MIQDMNDNADGVSYEVDPARMETGEVLEDNQQNLAQITQRLFNAIVSSADRFPPQLRSLSLPGSLQEISTEHLEQFGFSWNCFDPQIHQSCDCVSV